MKAAWSCAGLIGVLVAGFMILGPAAANADDTESTASLDPYLTPLAVDPVHEMDLLPTLPIAPAAGIGTGTQISFELTWTHFGYGGALKAKGFGVGLRLDFNAGEGTDVFVEARVSQGIEDSILLGTLDTDITFDATTGLIGVSFMLPGSELITEAGESEAVFWHQFELGIGNQSYEADEDTFGTVPPDTGKFFDRDIDDSGPVFALRYRVGTQVGNTSFFSFLAGLETVKRVQLETIGPFPLPGGSVPGKDKERWDVDWTVGFIFGIDI